ncbi:MAG TPA: helix-turn-helix domain-containing protein [Candidatus Limnocylindrales bacterium]|nr:helix-turn-helix domain-containing protein [Candidatus Limnocylindrales bacterium]
MSTRDRAALRAVRAGKHGKHGKHVGLLEGRGGTGDESTGSDFAGFGQEDHLVAQAAEIIGISDRHMRRWRERYEEFGQDGLVERRRGKPSPHRVPVPEVEQVLGSTGRSTSI